MPEPTMTPAAFKHWRKHLGLSQKEAAEALGLKRRVVQYYEKGERDGDLVAIPRTVRLACWALLNGVSEFTGLPDDLRTRKSDKPAKTTKSEKPHKPEKKNRPASDAKAEASPLLPPPPLPPKVPAAAVQEGPQSPPEPPPSQPATAAVAPDAASVAPTPDRLNP